MKLHCQLALITIALISACKSSPSDVNAARDSNEGTMISSDGVFEIIFKANAFEDGMDQHFHGDKQGMKFTSRTSGMVMGCTSNEYCYLNVDLSSNDFAYTYHQYKDEKAGLCAMIIGQDAKNFYETFLSPWATVSPTRRTFGGVNMLEYKKTVFINYDNIGEIFCLKRKLDIDQETKDHYACFLTYKNAYTTEIEEFEYERNSEDIAWDSIRNEISDLGLD